ncbi:UspA domain protein [Haladaptatus paucihalophilus DX253]|uniref:Nucleotide-binding universal stress protein, UspA family n=1 Tax=Haladaptatus paucihalophilus DX253 TaxID=797209 RepID=E7QVC0_HALPU|nr:MULTISPECIES: universal stress protein [Haladaptatus]EFW91638.1 UspA domain protein [Haladaptatus paucihalophilus DX253]GKZ15967.1 universal stress protein UspA [Haladaptatus sp. T7]SHL22244.1 Nucleotide-binding universal stress protein, UspA family [Haladaptatus paucihalophilus DX253]
MYERILLPTDGSVSTDKAVEQALNLADAYGASLHVLSVVDRTIVPPDVRSDILYDELEDECADAVSDVEAAANEAGVDVETTVLRGTPHRVILDYADKNDIDCIVMGTHGRRGLDRYLLGSVTEKVVRLSEVPVLTVRMNEEE